MLEVIPHLPFSQDVMKKECERLANEAEKTYANILLTGSSRSVLPSLAFLNLKHNPGQEQLSRIARLLFKIFECAAGDVTGEARAAKALGRVLKTLNKTPQLAPHGHSDRLVIPWKPIYDCLLRVVFRGATWETSAAGEADQLIGAEAAKFHHASLLGFARKARNFFPVGAAEEILNELRQYFCPHDERSILRAAALLSHFLPDEIRDPAAVLVECFGVWELVPHCHEWNLLWVGIFSRLVRHNPEQTIPALQPMLPRLFRTMLRALNVPTAKSAPNKPDVMGWPGDLAFFLEGKKAKKDSVRKFVRLIVYSAGEGSATLDHLFKMLTYVQPFFHPLNEGEHSEMLTHFLSLLGLNFAKRIGIENGLQRAKKPWKGGGRLTEDHVHKVTETILPLAFTCLRSKDSSTSFLAAQAIKDLWSMWPDIVMPQVTDLLLPTMENVMKPHEVQSAIVLSSIMVGPLLRTEGGLDQIGQILRITVAGIDLNDPEKTLYTFRMLMSVMSQVPLFDPADLTSCSSKPEMLYGLQEWVVEIIDRLFQVLSNLPTMTKDFYMGQILSGVVGRFCDVFMQQMSPKLNALAMERIARKVVNGFLPTAQKFVGYIVDSAVFSSPAEGLKAMVPQLCAKVLHNGIVNTTENEAVYCLHLLGHALKRAGHHSQAHAQQIEAVLEAVCFHKDKKYYKEGQKTLRKYVCGLLDVVPADNRSLPPSRWSSSNVKDFSTICGVPLPPDQAEVTFRVPNEECISRARAIVDKFCTLALAKLQGGDAAPADMRMALGCLTNIVRGADVLFPPREAQTIDSRDAEGEEQDIDDADRADDEIICTGLARLISTDNDGGWGQNVRTTLGNVLIQFCRKHAKAENPDVATLKQAIKLVKVYLANQSGGSGKWNKKKQSCTYNKSIHRNWTQGVRSYMRDLVINRTNSLLLRRMEYGVYEASAESDELIDTLASLCMHEYSLVRKKAQKCLPIVMRRFPFAGNRVITRALSVIATPSSTKGSVNGAIYTVQTAWALRKVSRHWGLFKLFVTALIESRSVEDTKLQVRLAELWTAYVPYTFPNPLHGPAHPQALVLNADIVQCVKDTPQSVFAQGEQALERRRVACMRTCSELATMLEAAMLGTGPQGQLHWRYVILAASALSLLIRKDIQMSATSIQICEKLGKGKDDAMEVDDAGSSKDGGTLLTCESFEQSANRSTYVDQIWKGWNTPYAAGSGQQLSYSAADSVFASLAVKAFSDPTFVSSTCDKMSQDHRLNGDEVAASAQTSAPGMSVASSGISTMFAARWPQAPGFSGNAFSANIMQTVCAVARSGGISACEQLCNVLDKNAKSASDREQQCLAAEIFCGMLRASLEWEDADAARLQQTLVPLVDHIFGSMSAEATPFWMDSLRFIASHRDPRRLQWVCESLARTNVDDAHGSGPQLRVLKLCKALTIEFGWRGLVLFKPLAPMLRRLMNADIKSVSEEAATCLAIVARATSPIARAPCTPTSAAAVPQASSLVTSWLPQHMTELLLVYSTQAPPPGTQERKSLHAKIEGSLFFFIHSMRLGWSLTISMLMKPALQLMLAVQEDGDKELTQVGKLGYELVATSCNNETTAAALLDTVQQMISIAASWRVRSSVVDFVRELGHSFVQDPSLFSRCMGFVQEVGLRDSVPEVRQNSCASLAGLLRAAETSHIRDIIANAPKMQRRAAKGKGASEGKSDEDKAKELVARHARVLAVAACVLSHPTELPEWMADAVAALCSLQNEETMIQSTITKTASEFKKSHQDVWHIIQTTWTEDQLQMLSDFGGTHSYYS